MAAALFRLRRQTADAHLAIGAAVGHQRGPRRGPRPRMHTPDRAGIRAPEIIRHRASQGAGQDGDNIL